MDEKLTQVFKQYKRIHVVGLSPDPDRPSFDVSRYMQAQGFKIIPIRPEGTEILGEVVYPDLATAPGPVEIVNVFRKSEFVSEIIDQAMERGVKVIWLQDGVTDLAAESRARSQGIKVFSNMCILREHRRLKSMGLI